MKNKKKEVVFETLWRNKFLCTDAKSFDEFIEILEGAVAELKEMRAAGIKLEDDGGVGDDYAHFTTTDPKIAEKFGLEENDWDEGEEDDFEESFCVVEAESEEIVDILDTLQEAITSAYESMNDAKSGSVFFIEHQDKNLKKFTKLVNGEVVQETLAEVEE